MREEVAIWRSDGGDRDSLASDSQLSAQSHRPAQPMTLGEEAVGTPSPAPPPGTAE